jgi:aminoglycoside phosphotransferase family enzyme/predicted kinase
LPTNTEGRNAFAEVRETHVGVVFLVGDRAYKLKKPVDVGFLDFSSRERRLAVCRREVELNRRLAPDVYLGVADVTDPDGSVCEHLVVMRRMPDQRRLSSLVERGEPADGVVRRLARLVAAFHATAQRGPHISIEGSRDAILGRWMASFEQVRALGAEVMAPCMLAEIQRRTVEFLLGRDALFAARIAQGRVVDGHGDLLADDIFCLDDGPRVLDCLEFDDRLRFLDGLDDISFLAMDLERLGAPELATRLVDWYAEFADDPAPASLRHHYLAYRAFVRAKVAAIRLAQGDDVMGAKAVGLANIALRHLRSGTVRLVLVGGLPGTGKSTLGGMLADKLGMVLLSSDRMRKELVGLPPADHRPAEYRGGLYAPAHTERTYDALLARAETLLAHGESVVIDASWISAAHRKHAAELAERTHSELVPLRCRVPADTAAARMRIRRGAISDADPAIAASMAADADEWPDAFDVHTTGDPDHSLKQALSFLEADPAG